MDDLISRQWLMECVNEGWIKFDTEKDANTYIHLVRDIAPSAQPDVSDINVGDTIYRQAAINSLKMDISIIPYAKAREYVSAALETVFNRLEQLPPAQPEWIPCSEKLPDNRVCVIVCFREWQQYAKRYIYSIVMGWYARKHSVRENDFSEWEADCDYDEDEDEYYIQEGWYEFTTQGNSDLMNWYINAEVVAWMPLPEPYKGEQDEQKPDDEL